MAASLSTAVIPNSSSVVDLFRHPADFDLLFVPVRCRGCLSFRRDISGGFASPTAAAAAAAPATASVLPCRRLPSRPLLRHVGLCRTSRFEDQQHRRPPHEGPQTCRVTRRRARSSTLPGLSRRVEGSSR